MSWCCDRLAVVIEKRQLSLQQVHQGANVPQAMMVVPSKATPSPSHAPQVHAPAGFEAQQVHPIVVDPVRFVLGSEPRADRSAIAGAASGDVRHTREQSGDSENACVSLNSFSAVTVQEGNILVEPRAGAGAAAFVEILVKDSQAKVMDRTLGPGKGNLPAVSDNELSVPSVVPPVLSPGLVSLDGPSQAQLGGHVLSPGAVSQGVPAVMSVAVLSEAESLLLEGQAALAYRRSQLRPTCSKNVAGLPDVEQGLPGRRVQSTLRPAVSNGDAAGCSATVPLVDTHAWCQLMKAQCAQDSAQFAAVETTRVSQYSTVLGLGMDEDMPEPVTPLHITLSGVAASPVQTHSVVTAAPTSLPPPTMSPGSVSLDTLILSMQNAQSDVSAQPIWLQHQFPCSWTRTFLSATRNALPPTPHLPLTLLT